MRNLLFSNLKHLKTQENTIIDKEKGSDSGYNYLPIPHRQPWLAGEESTTLSMENTTGFFETNGYFFVPLGKHFPLSG